MLESDVFNRTEPEGAPVSDATYNLIIGLVLCWGFLINGIIVAQVSTAWLAGVNVWVFLVAYFASCFFGVFLFNRSTDPAISFIGYNFVVVPFGLVLNLVVSRYAPDLVLQAIETTAMVTAVMMILGAAVPAFFQFIYGGLVISLLLLVVFEFVQIFILRVHSDWLDWAAAAIFCGYIGHDWGRANRIPKTVDNAVDSAAEIYMDIINLFLRILRILGRRR